jgi:Leucine-rich repeat (LRR) protein
MLKFNKYMIKFVLILILGLALSGCVTTIQPDKPQNPPTPVSGESNTGANTNTDTKTVTPPANIPPVVVDSSKRLDLSGRNLEKIERSVFDKTSLEELDVANNNLTGALPAEIRLLRNLRRLDASQNQMTGIPAEIGQLSRLEELDYSGNGIDTMPNEIENLNQLKYLSLSGNTYRDFPEKLLGLSRLETLDFSANRLTRLPDNIGQLRGLKRLILTGNNIEAAEIARVKSALPDTNVVY